MYGESRVLWCHGHVAELAYAYASGAYGETLGSSNLPVPTIKSRKGLFVWYERARGLARGEI